MIELKGKNALITGSTRGIGQQIALGLASFGCNIIIHGRTKESSRKTQKLLSKYNIKTYGVYGDLSDEKQVKTLIKQVQGLNVSIDILYNNAAIMTSYREDIWTHSWDDWTKSFKVNVMAMYSLCGAFIPRMIENGFGRVVNLTSGIKDKPELAPYGASKWAVDKMTDDISIKLKNTGVRINTLDPGWLRTDMGGENAEHPVEAVLPGALAPIFIENDGPNGQFFSAINHNLDME
jgi:NAD(P)-dependent dehydrogenase (short-subunit alcohol dehydrogenase family)